MPNSIPKRGAAQRSLAHPASTPPASLRSSDWRCTGCSRLLGIFRDGQLHIRFARGHQYLAALPTSCTCRGCATLNRTAGQSR